MEGDEAVERRSLSMPSTSSRDKSMSKKAVSNHNYGCGKNLFLQFVHTLELYLAMDACKQ